MEMNKRNLFATEKENENEMILFIIYEKLFLGEFFKEKSECCLVAGTKFIFLL
jgi:hypothetical protein